MTSWLMPFAAKPNLRGSYAVEALPGDVDGAGDADGCAPGPAAEGDGLEGPPGDAASAEPPDPPDSPPDPVVGDAAKRGADCDGVVLAPHAERIGSRTATAASEVSVRRRARWSVIGSCAGTRWWEPKGPRFLRGRSRPRAG